MTTDRWRLDSLAVMIAFREHAGLSAPPEWTSEDADALEGYCSALMQAARQMTAGQEGYGKQDECGSLVDFRDVPQIENQIAQLACWMVMAGAHRKAVGR